MIDGVEIIPLKTYRDDRGFFREIFRFKHQFKDLSIGQLSHSLVEAEVVKGWHGHVYQHQWNYVVSGEIRVSLYDSREESPTYGEVIEFQAAEQNPIGYFFPPGVLHGYKCVAGPMQIIYVTSGSYDLDDEIRHPLDHVDGHTLNL